MVLARASLTCGTAALLVVVATSALTLHPTRADAAGTIAKVASIDPTPSPDPGASGTPAPAPTPTPTSTPPDAGQLVQLEPISRPNELVDGASLSSGDRLVAPGRHFALLMRKSGNLVEIARNGQREWSTNTRSYGAKAKLRPNGAFVVVSSRGRRLWKAPGTGGMSGRSSRLHLARDGALDVRGPGRSRQWSNHLSSRCTAGMPRRAIVIDISLQHLWACHRSRLILSTPITTAATDRGWVTPTGTWHVYSKQREVNLVGSTWNDHVHYWMPYSGPYGIHDATWQHFPEGSSRYKSKGSHGCTHVPLREMHQLYSWAPIGTQVTVRA